MFAENNNQKENMLIYNTTFQVDDAVHDNFLIWIKESYIPEVQKHGTLRAPRICRILSHRDDGTSYSYRKVKKVDCCIAGTWNREYD